MHGVNCRGVMGAGFALEIKKRFPEAYKLYKQRCEERTPEMLLGTSMVTPISTNLVIMHCFTQKDYGKIGKHVSYDAFESCLYTIPAALHHTFVKELHFPMIGAGLGGGKWDVMAAIIDTHYAAQKVMKYLWVQ